MKKEEIKKFELNTKLLDDFDKIMSTKLDEIEELRVTGLDNGSKLLNIISLCANIKTLIIEGDQRLNSDKILKNIFKPELLENLVINNSKLPKSSSLKCYKNLKMISLNNIRICDIKDFFEGIVNPKRIEIINLSNIDFSNHSITILNSFYNFKYLNLNNLKNIKIDDLSFLEDSKKILKLSISNQNVPLSQLKYILECKCKKNINVTFLNDKGKEIKDTKLCNLDNDGLEMTLPADKVEEMSEKMDLSKIDKIKLILNKMVEDTSYIKILRKTKKEIKVIIKDFSCLTAEDAEKMKKLLSIESITIKHTDYLIDEYIENRDEIDDRINQVSKHLTEPERFLEIYKLLGQECDITKEESSKILQNCLQCMKIKTNIITGEELETEKEHTWNQVKLNGKWYNTDLGLDIENIKRKKTKYCLLGDKKFIETHVPKAGDNHYCAEDFNQKKVNVFLKTGLYKDKLLASYIEILKEKIIKLFSINKKETTLELPSGNKDD